MTPINPTVIGLISACTALVASILAPTVALRAAKTQFNASVISANRQRWIEAFRDLVASFLSQLYAASLVRGKIVGVGLNVISADPAMLSRIEQMVLTTSKIRLMINTNESDHHKLYNIMSGALDLIRFTPAEQDIDEQVQSTMDEIAEICQALLKREWVRVKKGR